MGRIVWIETFSSLFIKFDNNDEKNEKQNRNELASFLFLLKRFLDLFESKSLSQYLKFCFFWNIGKQKVMWICILSYI